MSYADYQAKVMDEAFIATHAGDSSLLLAPLPASAGFARPRYMLMRDFVYTVTGKAGRQRTFTLHRGYCFDGATIYSRIGLTWALSVPPYHPWVMLPAAKHDQLCDIEPPFFPSTMAADLFGRDCRGDGISESKVRRMVWAVKALGPKW